MIAKCLVPTSKDPALHDLESKGLTLDIARVQEESPTIPKAALKFQARAEDYRIVFSNECCFVEKNMETCRNSSEQGGSPKWPFCFPFPLQCVNKTHKSFPWVQDRQISSRVDPLKYGPYTASISTFHYGFFSTKCWKNTSWIWFPQITGSKY